MLFSDPPAFIDEYTNLLNDQLSIIGADLTLSNTQRSWLNICLTGILSTNTVCWWRFQEASLGKYQDGTLSWMFRRSPLAWDRVLAGSTRAVLGKFGINEGLLVFDDSDRRRAKVTPQIPNAYKIHDKKTGGYFNGQTIVALVLVTNQITLPVGFDFYMPDPEQSKWKKLRDEFKKKKIDRAKWPKKPVTDPAKFPTKSAIAEKLLAQFKAAHPNFYIKAVLGDCHYGNALLTNQVTDHICPQMISELKCNQKVRKPHKKDSHQDPRTEQSKTKSERPDDMIGLETYFKNRPFTKTTIRVRGQGEQIVWFTSARLFVQAHNAKRLIIALHYDNQDKTETRYLVATDLSWRTQDIIQAFTYRWLVEVFFEDLKEYEGWGQLAKQLGDDGSRRVLILSLLLDHCLFFCAPNKTRLENKQPAVTVGSLTKHLRAQILVDCIKKLIQQSPFNEPTKKLADLVARHFTLNSSKKHLHGMPLGHLDPSPSLQRRFPHPMKLSA
jgi:hypothetical protein